MIVIDAEFMAKYPVEVGPFSHLHFTCEQLTPAGLASRLQGLSAHPSLKRNTVIKGARETP